LTTDPSMDFGSRWSPDGKWILFTSNRSGINQSWKIPAKGGSPELVTKTSASFGTMWSLDGKHIYYCKASNIWQISEDGDNEQSITDFKDKLGNFQFPSSTDGQYIYFVLREDSGDIWTMDVAGTVKTEGR